MKTFFNHDDCEALIQRLQYLTPNSSRQWGQMNLEQMVCHCTDQIRMCLGELKSEPVGGRFDHTVFKWLVIWVLPKWPKSPPSPKELLQTTGAGTPPTQFEQDRQKLILYIHRLANVSLDFIFGEHATFGKLNRAEIGRLVWRHLDHHLRQFNA